MVNTIEYKQKVKVVNTFFTEYRLLLNKKKILKDRNLKNIELYNSIQRYEDIIDNVATIKEKEEGLYRDIIKLNFIQSKCMEAVSYMLKRPQRTIYRKRREIINNIYFLIEQNN